jgi:hypothetical protein
MSSGENNVVPAEAGQFVQSVETQLALGLETSFFVDEFK